MSILGPGTLKLRWFLLLKPLIAGLIIIGQDHLNSCRRTNNRYWNLLWLCYRCWDNWNLGWLTHQLGNYWIMQWLAHRLRNNWDLLLMIRSLCPYSSL